MIPQPLHTITTTTPKNIRYAGFWVRFFANFIDSFLMGLVYFFGLFLIPQFILLKILGILCILGTMAYKPYMEYQHGATVGKMQLDLKVVNDQHEAISKKQSLIRYMPWLIQDLMAFLIGGFILFLGGNGPNNIMFLFAGFILLRSKTAWFVVISTIAIIFDKKKQALHDKIAKTYCIHAN